MVQRFCEFMNYKPPNYAGIIGGCTFMRKTLGSLRGGFIRNLPIWDLSKGKLHGIEIEAENLGGNFFYSPETGHVPWNLVPEGSLRNNGGEYVSFPLKGDQIPLALWWLYKYHFTRNENPVFSSRTSVHIHIDSRTWTVDNLLCFLLLYLMYERWLFEVAGEQRAYGNFCVPLSEIFVGHYHWLSGISVHTPIDVVIGILNRILHGRYTALNLYPLIGNHHERDKSLFGTLEFRHYRGSNRPEDIYDWMRLISELHSTSEMFTRNELIDEIQLLNTSSQHLSFTKKIFNHTHGQMAYCDLNKLIEGVRDIKQWFKVTPNYTYDLEKAPILREVKALRDLTRKQDAVNVAVQAWAVGAQKRPAKKPLRTIYNPSVFETVGVDLTLLRVVRNNRVMHLIHIELFMQDENDTSIIRALNNAGMFFKDDLLV